MLQFLICLCIHRSINLSTAYGYKSQRNWDHPQARCLLSATPTAGRKTVLSLRKKRHLAAGAILVGPWQGGFRKNQEVAPNHPVVMTISVLKPGTWGSPVFEPLYFNKK